MERDINMTKCNCGKNADIKEHGIYLCAECWIKLNWRKP
tara:strand:- start:42 stop:158 length:117 start_codon:yes stop_codon:yes gene_type:complete